ncbi:Flocculation suppression protein [Coemansia sp. RSA 2599]|nr:Flocculation suppression protein [Coemansia sp. RSA 2599]
MVTDASTDSLISWTSEGDCFKVTDPMEFSRNVLPAYFKHGNWQSFVRQLNMYGFHKISDLAYGGIFGDIQLWMFKHPFFQRGELKMLQKVKRRGPKAASSQSSNVAGSGSGSGSVTDTSPLCVSSAQVASPDMPEEQLRSSAAAPQAYSCAYDLDKAEAKPYCNPSASADAQPPSAEFAGPCIVRDRAAEAASSADSPTAHIEPIREYVDDLKSCIRDLQQSNSQLHQENQKMRATIANCQNAFAGIMTFLETAIVKPSTQVAELPATPSLSVTSGYPNRRIADAFSKLVSDVAPVVSDLGRFAAVRPPTPAYSHIGATSAGIPLGPFRAAPSKFTTDSEALGSRHASQGQRFWHHEHGHERERQVLPPIRPGPSAQSSEGPRIPSLSPPADMSKKRRSSSSSSSCNNSEAGDADTQPLTPYIVLPPISGMVDSLPRHKALLPHQEDIHLAPKNYAGIGSASAGGYWKAPRQPNGVLSTPHESSLRETLPQKRARLD